MTQTERRHLERAADQYLRDGRIDACVAAYRQLGRRGTYVRKLREQADASLRHGNVNFAASAFIAAGCLKLPRRHR